MGRSGRGLTPATDRGLHRRRRHRISPIKPTPPCASAPVAMPPRRQRAQPAGDDTRGLVDVNAIYTDNIVTEIDMPGDAASGSQPTADDVLHPWCATVERSAWGGVLTNERWSTIR